MKGGKRRKHKTARRQRGGGMIEDAAIVLGAAGLYSYFVKNKK